MATEPKKVTTPVKTAAPAAKKAPAKKKAAAEKKAKEETTTVIVEPDIKEEEEEETTTTTVIVEPTIKEEITNRLVGNDSVFDNHSLQDKILNMVDSHLPNLYAENVDYTEGNIYKNIYILPCMEDFFIPEKTILLGDKGTGKTAFYKALQITSFFGIME